MILDRNSWLTSKEQDLFMGWLESFAGKRSSMLACGSGGPALRIAATTGFPLWGSTSMNSRRHWQTHWPLSEPQGAC